MGTEHYPKYTKLPALAGGERHAWGVFGPDDQLGTLNFITPQAVAAAAATVREGRVFNLSLPLNLPEPNLVSRRQTYRHHIEVTRTGRDDWLDQFYLQASSQWDGLAYIRYREFGYYGGRDEEKLDAGELGMDILADHGIVGRGVLVDAAAFFVHRGRPIVPNERVPIQPEDLEAILEWEKVKLQPGDILLVRTGWLSWYLALPPAERQALAGAADGGTLQCPGLAPGTEMAAWLWDHRVAAVAADNPALEALPVRREEGFLHRRLVALLGMPIGELWYLDQLAQACRQIGRYVFLLVSVPLKIPKGVGSPNNACAIL